MIWQHTGPHPSPRPGLSRYPLSHGRSWLLASISPSHCSRLCARSPHKGWVCRGCGCRAAAGEWSVFNLVSSTLAGVSIPPLHHLQPRSSTRPWENWKTGRQASKLPAMGVKMCAKIERVKHFSCPRQCGTYHRWAQGAYLAMQWVAGGGGGEERMPPPNIAAGAQRVASVPGSSAHCVTVRDKTPLSRHLSRLAPPTPRLLNMSAPLCLVSCVFQTELTKQYMHSSNVQQSIQITYSQSQCCDDEVCIWCWWGLLGAVPGWFSPTHE